MRGEEGPRGKGEREEARQVDLAPIDKRAIAGEDSGSRVRWRHTDDQWGLFAAQLEGEREGKKRW